MGVLDGQPVNAAITNPAFINKNINDNMPNILGFNRISSGPNIADIQQAVNNLYTATGVSETQTGTQYNAPLGTILNGDSHLVALTKLARKFDALTGHLHTGTAGDAPLLHVVRSLAITGSMGIFGDLTLISGAGVAITQGASGFTFSVTGGSTTIAASGNPPLSGNVVLVAGAGVSLSQSGQNITIAATGGFLSPDIIPLTTTGTRAGSLFIVPNTTTASAGDTYTNSGNTYTVLYTITSGNIALLCSGSGIPSAPSGTLTRTSGSGSATIAYTNAVPLAQQTVYSSQVPVYIKVKFISGGGGGGAGSNSGGFSPGNDGEPSSFGPIVNTGGQGGPSAATMTQSVGGVADVNGVVNVVTGIKGTTVNGAAGTIGKAELLVDYVLGGNGAASFYGGGAPGGPGNGAAIADAVAFGSGGGGGGAGSSGSAGSGGSAGAWSDIFIFGSALSPSFYYCVGLKGNNNSGTFAGSNGARGDMLIEVYYQ